MKYLVMVPEVYYSHRIVEAESEDQAKELGLDAEDHYLEYSHTLPIDPKIEPYEA